MTHSLRWRARVLVEADRTSTTAAADRNGVTKATIAGWRKDLADDPELGGHYEREDEMVSRLSRERYLDDIAETVSVGVKHVRELIPQTEPGDLLPLVEALCKLAAVAVQGNSLPEKRKLKDGGLQDHRGRPPSGTVAEEGGGERRH